MKEFIKKSRQKSDLQDYNNDINDCSKYEKSKSGKTTIAKQPWKKSSKKVVNALLEQLKVQQKLVVALPLKIGRKSIQSILSKNLQEN